MAQPAHRRNAPLQQGTLFPRSVQGSPDSGPEGEETILPWLPGREDHGHGPALELGLLLDLGELFGHLGDLDQDFLCLMGKGDLPSSEYQGNLYLVSVLDKFPDMLDLSLQVLGIGSRPDLALFYLNTPLLFPGFLLLLCQLVLEPAVIHYLADRRDCRRGDFNEIHFLVQGPAQGILEGHDPDLFSGGADDPDLPGPDIPVYVDPVLIALFSYSTPPALQLPVDPEHRQTYGICTFYN